MTLETKTWLEHKFTEWRHGRSRKDDSLEAFSKWLGVSRNSLNNWINRGHTPGEESVALLASKLGNELYDLVGLPRPDPALQQLIDAWGNLPNEAREEIDAIRQRSAARREAAFTDTGVEISEQDRASRN